MICLHCGYCCKKLAVVIVDDPTKGIVEGNLITSGGRCKHLQGDTPGQYSCAVHDEPWYAETPCFAYTQIGKGACRMGKHLMKNSYRKKSVIIQAYQITDERFHDQTNWPDWLVEALEMNFLYLGVGQNLFIKTLEGPMRVDVNDWIIQGVEGELYPCKPTIFDKTYEAVI